MTTEKQKLFEHFVAEGEKFLKDYQRLQANEETKRAAEIRFHDLRNILKFLAEDIHAVELNDLLVTRITSLMDAVQKASEAGLKEIRAVKDLAFGLAKKQNSELDQQKTIEQYVFNQKLFSPKYHAELKEAIKPPVRFLHYAASRLYEKCTGKAGYATTVNKLRRVHNSKDYSTWVLKTQVPIMIGTHPALKTAIINAAQSTKVREAPQASAIPKQAGIRYRCSKFFGTKYAKIVDGLHALAAVDQAPIAQVAPDISMDASSTTARLTLKLAMGEVKFDLPCEYGRDGRPAVVEVGRPRPASAPACLGAQVAAIFSANNPSSLSASSSSSSLTTLGSDLSDGLYGWGL